MRTDLTGFQEKIHASHWPFHPSMTVVETMRTNKSFLEPPEQVVEPDE